jgi:CBS domain containing-hemolysin-like protein
MDTAFVTTIFLKLLAVMALVLLNGFFVATEFALVKVRATQLETLASKNHKRARMALHLTNHLDEYLSACQLGITLSSLGLGWIGEPVFADLLEPLYGALGIDGPDHAGLRHSMSFGVGFSIITFLHIVAGEMAPKSLAIRLPQETSLWVAFPMRVFYFVMYPFIWLLNESSLLLLRMVGIQPAGEEHGVHSEEELKLVFNATQKRAGATALGRAIVLNALDLRRRVVREVMRPRQEIAVLNTASSITECLEQADRTRYSRFPLCEDGDVDRMLGAVHIKDLFAMRLKAKSGAELASVAKKLIYVPESARLERVLQLLLDRKLHMAVVVDEFGGTMGLLTLENILEQLVGQIQDEFDQEKPMLLRSSETTWEVAGALPLHELESLVGEPLRSGDLTTANGLVTQKLGGFPKVGDTLQLGQYELRVEEMDGMRVSRLRLTRQAPQAESAPDA